MRSRSSRRAELGDIARVTGCPLGGTAGRGASGYATSVDPSREWRVTATARSGAGGSRCVMAQARKQSNSCMGGLRQPEPDLIILFRAYPPPGLPPLPIPTSRRETDLRWRNAPTELERGR